jgi:ATP-binding cassette subfamily C protein LapB
VSLSLSSESSSSHCSHLFPTGSFNRWLGESIWHLRGLYRDVLLASLMLNLFVLASPLYIMNVYDRVVPNQAQETLWVLTLGLLLVLLFDLVIRLSRHHFIELAGRRMEQVLSTRLFARVLSLRLDQLPPSVGAFANQIREFDAVRQLFSAASFAALADLPFALLFLLVIWSVGGSLVWVPVLSALLMFLYASVIHIRLKPWIATLQEQNAAKNAVLVETLSGLETVKAFSAQSRQWHTWDSAVRATAHAALQSRKLADSIPLVSGFLAQLAVAGMVVAGVYQILAQELSLGGLIAAVLLTGRALAPATQAINLMSLWHQAREAMQTLQQLSLKPVDRPEGRNWIALPAVRGELDVEQLEFGFDPQQTVLHQINLRIQPGEKVAIVGRIGSGKSTLLRLLAGLLPASKGVVKLDGIGVAHIDPELLRRQYAWVPQEITLYRGTLRDNILLKNPQASDEALMQAIECAGLADFVARHPMGVDMPIGEQGRGVSGGQRQSIAIARAVLDAPPILLFDELTSAMDNQSEQFVLSQIARLAETRTLILSTHRSALLALVQRVIVLDQGRIVADGPKEEVIDALKRGLVAQK